MKLTIYYDGQFWVGVMEEDAGDQLRASRHVFGPSEPSDPEVLDFVLQDLLLVFRNLIAVAPTDKAVTRRRNPKRIQREVRREAARVGVSSRAVEALQQDIERNRHERKVLSRERREEARELKRRLARLKAKAKHRGR